MLDDFVLYKFTIDIDDGVAQWLGRPSLAGRLPWSVPNLRLTWLWLHDFVAMGQPTSPTQPSIPPGSVNDYINYMDYGGGDH